MAGEQKGSKRTIRIESTLSAGTLRSRITVSQELQKYFRSFDFFSVYDSEIFAGKSILPIPALSLILPFAWIVGADVFVDVLDRTFAESMIILQQEFKKMYPGAPFNTTLMADRLIEDRSAAKHTALLFSGGLDSTYMFFRHIARRPILIMLLGTVDTPLSNVAFGEALQQEYSQFAKREELPIRFVRTNVQDILDKRRVSHYFWKFQERLQGDYWLGIGYSLAHAGQVAPLSIGRFDELLVAGALDEGLAHDERTRAKYPDASYPSTDEKIAWADVRVRHYADIARHQKALALKDFLGAHAFTLRPCTRAAELCSQARSSPGVAPLNCNRCPKCLRTIVELVLAGINPRECGLSPDHSTFARARDLFRGELTRQDIALWWKPLQDGATGGVEMEIPGSTQFFEWLKSARLDSFGRRRERVRSLLYHKMPYPIANFLRLAWERLSRPLHQQKT